MGSAKKSKKKEELNEALYALSKEMISNISYAEDHVKQLENMLYMTEYILSHFEDYTVVQLKKIHDERPFIHYFDIDNNVRYLNDYQDAHLAKFFLWWNAWEPNDILYNTLANSGKLLEVENNDILEELESIYTKQKERNEGMADLRRLGCERLYMEQLEKMREQKLTLFASPYYEYRSHNLYVEMVDSRINLEGGIAGINDYLSSLRSINKIIQDSFGETN